MRGTGASLGRLGVLLTAAAIGLGACGQTGTTGRLSEPGGPTTTESKRPEGLRGSLALGSPARNKRATVQVNTFAWRAALDSVSFMPLRTSDPYGGVIATDWYISEAAPKERLRVNVLVSGPDLRSDTVRVTVLRETLAGRGTWQPAKVNPQTARDLENVILTRARDLRIAAGN